MPRGAASAAAGGKEARPQGSPAGGDCEGRRVKNVLCFGLLDSTRCLRVFA